MPQRLPRHTPHASPTGFFFSLLPAEGSLNTFVSPLGCPPQKPPCDGYYFCLDTGMPVTDSFRLGSWTEGESKPNTSIHCSSFLTTSHSCHHDFPTTRDRIPLNLEPKSTLPFSKLLLPGICHGVTNAFSYPILPVEGARLAGVLPMASVLWPLRGGDELEFLSSALTKQTPT